MFEVKVDDWAAHEKATQLQMDKLELQQIELELQRKGLEAQVIQRQIQRSKERRGTLKQGVELQQTRSLTDTSNVESLEQPLLKPATWVFPKPITNPTKDCNPFSKSLPTKSVKATPPVAINGGFKFPPPVDPIGELLTKMQLRWQAETLQFTQMLEAEAEKDPSRKWDLEWQVACMKRQVEKRLQMEMDSTYFC